MAVQVSEDEMVAWLRREVSQDLAAARDLIESEAASPVWSEMTSGVLVTGPPEHDDTWSGTFAMGDSRLTRFIAGRDPQWVIADCEAKLAVLDEHYILWRHDMSEAYEEFSVVSIGGANKDHGCVTCHYYGQGGVKGYGYCRTVRLLGYGYRFRRGYREAEWKP